VVLANVAWTMTFEQLDQITHYAIETLFGNDDGWRSLTRDLVHLWPDAGILEICFALVVAASAVESNFNANSPSRAQSAQAYRLAALVSADLYAMAAIGGYGSRARDLASYWRDHDSYFLTL